MEQWHWSQGRTLKQNHLIVHGSWMHDDIMIRHGQRNHKPKTPIKSIIWMVFKNPNPYMVHGRLEGESQIDVFGKIANDIGDVFSKFMARKINQNNNNVVF